MADISISLGQIPSFLQMTDSFFHQLHRERVVFTLLDLGSTKSDEGN